MAIYKLNQHSTESSPTSVTLDKGDGVILCIPFNSANRDYQEYLEWVAAGNTPDPVS